jgi:2-polyprenyl-3-methyl-5-hydroxy-6-metoxy-1,4-benzoquinol methylase
MIIITRMVREERLLCWRSYGFSRQRKEKSISQTGFFCYRDIDMNDESYPYLEEVNQGILKFIDKDQIILDVGCGFGALGEELKKENYVVGLDISQYAINIAKKRIDEAYLADVTQLKTLPLSRKRQFDLIIFADILEHVYNPQQLLKDYKHYLKPRGHIIVSVPNVASWPVRIGLFFGRFEYKESGVLDKTHIRFFTKKGAKKVIEDAGYEIQEMGITPYFARIFLPLIKKLFNRFTGRKAAPQAIVKSKSYQMYLKWIYPLESMCARIISSFFAFQFIFFCRKID